MFHYKNEELLYTIEISFREALLKGLSSTLSPNDSYTKQNILVSFIIICFSNDNINDANVRKKKGRFIEIYIFFFNMEYYGQNTWSS